MNKILTLLTIIALTGCASTGTSSRPQNNKQQLQAARADAASTNVQLASGYYREGDLETALDKIQRALAFDPKSSDAHMVAGVIYEAIDDAKNARKHYKKAVQLNPNDGNALNNYGQYLCGVGNVDQAVKLFEQAANQPFYKTPEAALLNAGSCREQQELLNDAENFYRRALNLDKYYPDALIRLSGLMLRTGKALQARGFLQRFEAIAADTAQSLWLGTQIEQQLGNQKQKQQYGEKLLKQFPNSQQSNKYKQTAQA